MQDCAAVLNLLRRQGTCTEHGAIYAIIYSRKYFIGLVHGFRVGLPCTRIVEILYWLWSIDFKDDTFYCL